MDPWRIVKEDPTKIDDGKTCYWCPRYKKEGVYDGICFIHPPNKHDEWSVRKNNWRKKKTSSSTSTQDSKPSITNQKLGLSSDLKAVIVANFHCTQEEADKLWSDTVQNSALN